MILISGYSGRCLAGQTRGKRFNLIELLEVRRMFDPHTAAHAAAPGHMRMLNESIDLQRGPTVRPHQRRSDCARDAGRVEAVVLTC